METTGEPGPTDEFEAQAIPVSPPLRILLVDDNDLVRETLLRMLRRRGHHAQMAKDSDEALALCQDPGNEFDLMVSDLMMPGRSGLELVAILRRSLPGLRCLLVSGYSDLCEPLAGLSRAAFLAKPFTAASLQDAIERVMAMD